MNKIVLSVITALTLGTVSASATQFYTDDNGQVFTKGGKGRVAIKAPTSIFSHSDKIKFNGQAFIGYKSFNATDAAKRAGATDKNDFEVRRGYFQVKAYLLDDSKSYYRVTLDMKQNDNFDGGSLDVRAKYAYLYLDNILPFTGVEIGLAHRPWHDYEEHNSWMYRSISEILIENHNSAHLSSSADYGVMTKTRTKFLDADIGVFNGEGYHSTQNAGNGMSLEWRFTGHLLGTHGHPEKNTYFDTSFFGQLNYKHSADTTVDKNTDKTTTNGYDDLKFYGFHAVYNQPSFLVSAQYVTSTDDAKTETIAKTTNVHSSVYVSQGSGYSANVEGRIGSNYQYKAFARYDKWTPDVVGSGDDSKITEIAGVAWKQNRNVEWVANVTVNNNDKTYEKANGTAYMLTTQIDF